MNENALNAFLKLAETGSFQQAARDIDVSNASLSRYIAQAEEHTGFALFHRNRNNSKLTREGQEFLPIAIKLKADLEQYAKQVVNLQDKGRSTLLIGCGPLTTREIVLPVIKQVLLAMPEMRFRILVSAYGRPLDLLQNGEFDIFIGDLTYTPNAEGVEIMVLEKRPIAFMAHIDHEIHQLGPCSLKDIFSYPFASAHLHKHWRTTLMKALGDDAQAANIVNALPKIESDDYGCLTGLLSEPDFIVGGMRSSFNELLSTGAISEIPLRTPISWNICASRKETDSSAALDLFWAKLIEVNATMD
ncbi:MAG: LysR family transcriptional regulator [Roseobacter sp.]